MKLYATIRHLLAACLIAGLFLATMTAARSAQGSACPMMTEGMDCCPDMPAHHAPPKCPLMALCLSTFVVEQDARTVVAEPTMLVVRKLPPSGEPTPTGHGYAPPSRPPRVLA